MLPKSKWQIFDTAVISYGGFCPQETATLITSFSLQEGWKESLQMNSNEKRDWREATQKGGRNVFSFDWEE